MPYLKRINSLPLINHISYKYTQVSDIGPSWSSCLHCSYWKLRVYIWKWRKTPSSQSINRNENIIMQTIKRMCKTIQIHIWNGREHCWTRRTSIFTFSHYNIFKRLWHFIWPFPKQALVRTCLQNKSFENTVGKGETARNECFLPTWRTVFSTHLENILPFSSSLKLSSARSFSL